MNKEKLEKYYIYYHMDPRTNLPVYIGKGSGNRAWIMSKNQRGKNHYKWICELRSKGLAPDVFIGKRSDDEDLIYKAEKLDITVMRKVNLKLLNVQSGGRRIKGKPLNTKSVYCYETKTVYDSITDAGSCLSLLHYTNISTICHGRLRSYRGYTFDFLDPILRNKAEQERIKRKENGNKTRFKSGCIPWNKKEK